MHPKHFQTVAKIVCLNLKKNCFLLEYIILAMLPFDALGRFYYIVHVHVRRKTTRRILLFDTNSR